MKENKTRRAMEALTRKSQLQTIGKKNHGPIFTKWRSKTLKSYNIRNDRNSKSIAMDVAFVVTGILKAQRNTRNSLSFC